VPYAMSDQMEGDSVARLAAEGAPSGQRGLRVACVCGGWVGGGVSAEMRLVEVDA
jgi:hypothetical protein